MRIKGAKTFLVCQTEALAETWRKRHNEKHNNSYYPLNKITVTRSSGECRVKAMANEGKIILKISKCKTNWEIWTSV